MGADNKISEKWIWQVATNHCQVSWDWKKELSWKMIKKSRSCFKENCVFNLYHYSKLTQFIFGRGDRWFYLVCSHLYMIWPFVWSVVHHAHVVWFCYNCVKVRITLLKNEQTRMYTFASYVKQGWKRRGPRNMCSIKRKMKHNKSIIE